MYSIYAMPIKLPNTSFTEIENNPKIYVQSQKTRLTKINLSKSNNTGDITIPDFKLCYRAMVPKTAWYWHKNRHVDQRYRIEDLEINPCKNSAI
jgi:hypothetical protein